MRKLTFDFETRSAAPIKTCGAAAYAQHPSTDAVCLALKWQGEEPVIWYSEGFRFPECPDWADLPLVSDEQMFGMVMSADIVEAHNAQFEFYIWKYVMTRYGFPMFDKAKLRCSAAKAATFGLPRTLEGACAAMGVPQQKDMDGSRLMLRLCKPRKPHKDEMLRDADWQTRLYWNGTPEEFAREGRYCLQDVRAEESFSSALPELIDSEQKLWQLDLDINDRGVCIDTPAVNAILSAINEHTEEATDEFKRITGLGSPKQRNATLKVLEALGSEMEGLTARDVEAELSTTNNDTVRRILELRKSLAKSSTAKYTTMLSAKCDDDRIRGCLMYHGAGTGRWSGRLIQPQNFPRGTFSDVDTCINLFTQHRSGDVKLMYGDVMAAASTCLRGMIVPAKGKEFVCADYSSIEGRVLAWLAGEETALEVYRSGKDPYKVAASAIYHVPYEDVAKPQRQIGKVAELALGYQGAVGAFSAMATNYGVTLPENEIREIVEKWRESRPMTVSYWRDLDHACMTAVANPGKIVEVRSVKFRSTGKFLALRLPSGRCLWYAAPRIEEENTKWGAVRKLVVYDGVDSVTRKWTTQKMYGGLITENITQATARDLLVNGMFAVEAAGYPVVFHVHDEMISEVPEGFGSVEEFEKLMCTLPDWAGGLPIKAEGWRGKRYKK